MKFKEINKMFINDLQSITNKNNKQAMLSTWIRSLGTRQTNLLISKTHFSFAYMTNEQAQIQRGRKDFFNNTPQKLFKTDQKDFKQVKKRNENQTNIEEYVKTINEINREFLGIKLNTDYFKAHNEKTFDQICKPNKAQTYKINDLPFAVRSLKDAEANPSSQNETSSELPKNQAVKMLRSMISQERLMKELQRLTRTYFSDLLLKQRKSRLQVNFEAHSRQVVQTLKASKWSFKLSNKDEKPNIVLKNVSILKGVQVNRNNNYTVDSYKMDSDQADEGITTYTLFKKPKEEYPEAEWFAQKLIVARIEAEASDCPVIDVASDNSLQSSSKGVTHSFVFEADLTVPPSLSLLSLTPEQHLKSYRLKPQNIYITNVDRKNVWFNLAYKEDEKKFKLINKII